MPPRPDIRHCKKRRRHLRRKDGIRQRAFQQWKAEFQPALPDEIPHQQSKKRNGNSLRPAKPAQHAHPRPVEGVENRGNRIHRARDGRCTDAVAGCGGVDSERSQQRDHDEQYLPPSGVFPHKQRKKQEHQQNQRNEDGRVVAAADKERKQHAQCSPPGAALSVGANPQGARQQHQRKRVIERVVASAVEPVERLVQIRHKLDAQRHERQENQHNHCARRVEHLPQLTQEHPRAKQQRQERQGGRQPIGIVGKHARLKREQHHCAERPLPARVGAPDVGGNSCDSLRQPLSCVDDLAQHRAVGVVVRARVIVERDRHHRQQRQRKQNRENDGNPLKCARIPHEHFSLSDKNRRSL